jgi:hypothetical protein
MTLVVRDEADVVEAQIAFHLAAGVDFVVATDHASSDGTTEVLERYAARGALRLLRETGSVFRQSEWVTRMARLAATEYEADWVINSDADEFWWPSGGDLKEVLDSIDARHGIVRTFVRPFLPPADDGPFAERMTVRLSPSASIDDPASPFRPNTRLLHRGTPDVVVGTGNASVTSTALVALGGWAPVEVLHFPIRSFSHFERKFLAHAETVRLRRRVDHKLASDAARAGSLRQLYDAIAPGGERLLRGLEDGLLVLDVRLRDALRGLSADPSTTLSFSGRDARSRAGFAVDQAVLGAGELVRLHRRLDELDRRAHALETRDRRAVGGGAT